MFAIVRVFTLIFLLGLGQLFAEPQVVSDLELNRYQGKWYEVARLPNPFQKKCVRGITAEYTLLEDEQIEVLNNCVQKSGKIDSVTGLARRQSLDESAKLEVSFFSVLGFRPVWGDYWVIYIDDDYQVAVVGDREAKYAWVLSREFYLDAEEFTKALMALDRNGYDINPLVFSNP